VAHDLRTPLTSIGWSTENLLDGVSGDLTEAQREYLESVKGSVQRLDRMVANLLEVSRLDRGVIEIGWETIDLAPLVGDVSRTLAFMTDYKQVTINVTQGGGHTLVLGDPTKLFEVMINLLDNAVRYSPPEQTVDVTVGDLGEGRVGFSVRDRGAGLGEGS
jgi:signal transduction histidine kinase